MLKLISQTMNKCFQPKLFNLNIYLSSRIQRRQAKINKVLLEKKKKSIKKYEQQKKERQNEQKLFVKVRQIPNILQPNFYFKEINQLQKFNELPQQRLLQILSKHNNILQKLSQMKYSQKQFQNIWKKYNFYVAIIFEKVIKPLQQPLNLNKVNGICRFFNSITHIHSKFPQIKSQNIIKTINRVAHLILPHLDTLNFYEILNFINGCNLYNPKKAKAILIAKTNKITSKIAYMIQQSKQNPKIPLLLLKLMKQLDYHNNLYLQHSLNSIYPHIDYLNSNQIKSLLFYLGWSQSFINKTFFLRVASRLIKLIKSNNMTDQDIFRCASSVSIIQKNMSGISLNQLEGFYQYFVSDFCQKIDKMWSKQLATFANILRRAKIYHPLAIEAIINECLSRQINDFQQNTQQVELFDEKTNLNPIEMAKKKIQLQCLLIVFHMLATLNHRNDKFIQYTLEIIKLSFCRQKKKWISFELASRTIWSACILCTKQQVAKLYPMIQNYFENRMKITDQAQDSQKIQVNNNLKQPNIQESLNYYYSYLYLKTFFPKITLYNQRLKQLFSQQNFLKSKISKLHEDIHKAFIECGIPAIKQFNISNLMVDIFIPEYEGINNIVIQAHGFHHFLRDFSTTTLRNVDTHRNLLQLDGSSTLKKKLIQSQGYWYFYISIDEWQLLTNSTDQIQFIRKFMQRIKAKYEKKLSKVYTEKQLPSRRRRRQNKDQ